MKWTISVFAATIVAVIAAEGLEDIVPVGWSYGGLPQLDYVREHGRGKLGALVFAATGYNLDLGPPDAGGPGAFSRAAGFPERRPLPLARELRFPGAVAACTRSSSCRRLGTAHPYRSSAPR